MSRLLSRLSRSLVLSTAFAVSLFTPVLAVAATLAPNFPVDQHTRLSDYRGRVVYLDFWASWCTPCQASFPWLQRMQGRYQKHGLQVITVNLDKERKQAQAFLRRHHSHLPVVYDPSGHVATRYGVKAMPSSYLIDRHGRIVMSHMGFRDGDTARLESQIRRQLR